MDEAMEAADLHNTVMTVYRIMPHVPKTNNYWAADPTKNKGLTDDIKYRIQNVKRNELFQEVVYLTALLLHVNALRPEEVTDSDTYFGVLGTLRERAISHRKDFFTHENFTVFKYYKTRSSVNNITRFLTLCGQTHNGDQKAWLVQTYNSNDIVKIFFPNLYDTNVRTFSTTLSTFKKIQENARSRYANDLIEDRSNTNLDVYAECNPFTIFETIKQQLWSPKLHRSAWDSVLQSVVPEPRNEGVSASDEEERKRAALNAWGKVVSSVVPEPIATKGSQSYKATLEPVVNNKILRTEQQRELASDEEEDESSSENNNIPQGRKRAAHNAWGEVLSGVAPKPIATNESLSEDEARTVHGRWADVRADIKKPKKPPPPPQR
ncbi:MAG: hypothetical protein EOM62_20030, partial [Bacteroidia bacterium]|nr:hypothetical protein [Bacteroidia bacterium]